MYFDQLSGAARTRKLVAIFLSRFQPLLFILDLFQWFHIWNQEKTSENEQKFCFFPHSCLFFKDGRHEKAIFGNHYSNLRFLSAKNQNNKTLFQTFWVKSTKKLWTTFKKETHCLSTLCTSINNPNKSTNDNYVTNALYVMFLSCTMYYFELTINDLLNWNWMKWCTFCQMITVQQSLTTCTNMLRWTQIVLKNKI